MHLRCFWSFQFATIAAIVLMLLAACARTAPEQALRARMASLQSSIERRDVAAIGDVLADDFVGPDGMDRDGARRLAQLGFMRHRDVGVDVGPLEIDLEPRHATVCFTAVLRAGGVLPEAGQVYDVRTGWRWSGDEWLLVNASWTPRF